MTSPNTHRATAAPKGLGPGGRALWKAIATAHDLDGMQRVQLTEACRMKDRCDKLDSLLRGDLEAWVTILPTDSDGEFKVQVAGALGRANETANSMKQLLAALRLPDVASGKRPQQRGPRGVQNPTMPGGATGQSGKVSSIDRAKSRATSQTG